MATITELTERQLLERVILTLERALESLAELGKANLMWDRELDNARDWLAKHA